MKTALIVIDVQRYFVEEGAQRLPQKIADHISNFDYDAIAFTVFKNEINSNWERSLHWTKCKNQQDIELALPIQKFVTDNFFIKLAYSAFKAEGFEDYLKRHEIQRIALCGIDLEDCVLATGFEAFDKGYEVEVLFELCYSRNNSDNLTKSIILRDIQTKNEPR